MQKEAHAAQTQEKDCLRAGASEGQRLVLAQIQQAHSDRLPFAGANVVRNSAGNSTAVGGVFRDI